MWIVSQDRKYIGKIIHAWKDERKLNDCTIEYDIKVTYGIGDEDEFFITAGTYKQESERDSVFEALISCLGHPKATRFEFPPDTFSSKGLNYLDIIKLGGGSNLSSINPWDSTIKEI